MAESKYKKKQKIPAHQESYIWQRYPSKLKERFLDKQKQREFIARRHALQEMLTDVLQAEKSDTRQ